MLEEIKELDVMDTAALSGVLAVVGIVLMFVFSAIIGWVVYNDPSNIDNGGLRLLTTLLSFSPMFALWAARIYAELEA